MNGRKKKVLLFHSLPARDNLSDSDFRIAPIGLFFISWKLKKKGYEVITVPVLLPLFLEESTSSLEYRKELKERIIFFNPDYIGYSFRNLYHFGQPPSGTGSLADFFCISQDLPVISFIRKYSASPVIGGGSGFSLAPEFYMNYLDLDYGIIGEGECSLTMLLDRMNRNIRADDVPGLVYRTGHGIMRNQASPCVNDESGGMDLSCLGEFREIYYANGGYGSVQTKRGCSFRCSYCVYPYLEGSKYRLRPVGQVIGEIREYVESYGMRHIYFVDSVFSSPPDHSLAIADAIIENRLDINWYAYVNPSGLTDELLTRYRESGCAGLVLTLESGNDSVLKYLKKGFSGKDSIAAIENLLAAGIPFEVSMLAGSPCESEETLLETISFCKNHLKNVPVVFTPGVWMHPVSSVFSDYFGAEKTDSDVLSNIILSNDFKRHNELHYFFSDQTGRIALVQKFLASVEGEPLWFVLGKDIVPDYRSGIVRYTETDRIRRYSRPWYSGLLPGSTGGNNCLPM